MAFLFDRMKLVVEPSGAVGVAALLAGRIDGARIGVVLSGGNVGAARFAELLRRSTEKPAQSTSTTVRSAAATSASPPGQPPEHPAGQQLVDRRRRTRPPASAGSRSARNSPALLAALDHAPDRLDRLHELADAVLHLGAAGDLAHEHAHDVGLRAATCGAGSPRRGAAARSPARRPPRPRGCARGARPSSRGRRLEDLVLRREVVVEQAVCDAGLFRDVADA